jgi:hypothetical protein
MLTKTQLDRNIDRLITVQTAIDGEFTFTPLSYDRRMVRGVYEFNGEVRECVFHRADLTLVRGE